MKEDSLGYAASKLVILPLYEIIVELELILPMLLELPKNLFLDYIPPFEVLGVSGLSLLC